MGYTFVKHMGRVTRNANAIRRPILQGLRGIAKSRVNGTEDTTMQTTIDVQSTRRPNGGYAVAIAFPWGTGKMQVSADVPGDAVRAVQLAAKRWFLHCTALGATGGCAVAPGTPGAVNGVAIVGGYGVPMPGMVGLRVLVEGAHECVSDLSTALVGAAPSAAAELARAHMQLGEAVARHHAAMHRNGAFVGGPGEYEWIERDGIAGWTDLPSARAWAAQAVPLLQSARAGDANALQPALYALQNASIALNLPSSRVQLYPAMNGRLATVDKPLSSYGSQANQRAVIDRWLAIANAISTDAGGFYVRARREIDAANDTLARRWGFTTPAKIAAFSALGDSALRSMSQTWDEDLQERARTEYQTQMNRVGLPGGDDNPLNEALTAFKTVLNTLASVFGFAAESAPAGPYARTASGGITRDEPPTLAIPPIAALPGGGGGDLGIRTNYVPRSDLGNVLARRGPMLEPQGSALATADAISAALRAIGASPNMAHGDTKQTLETALAQLRLYTAPRRNQNARGMRALNTRLERAHAILRAAQGAR